MATPTFLITTADEIVGTFDTEAEALAALEDLPFLPLGGYVLEEQS